MSLHERNADAEFNPANPLGVINHGFVCQDIRSGLLETDYSISEGLAHEWVHQLIFDKGMCDSLVEIGSFILSPEITTQEAENSPKLRAYVAGIAAALWTVDATCRVLDIDTKAFRTVWRQNGIVNTIDLSADIFKDKTPQEKHEAVGDGVMLGGQKYLEIMDDCYSDLIDELADNYDSLVEANVFKSAYGYVLGPAQQAMARMFRVLEEKKILSEADFEGTFDTGIVYLSEEPIPVVYVPDDNIAEQIDTNMFYGESMCDVEAYLGAQVEKQLDKSDEVVETLQALALALYPNEFGNGALDEKGEAFFYGSILALEYVEYICKSVDVDHLFANRRWRSQNIHNRLYSTEFLPSHRELQVDNQVVKTLQRSELSSNTHALVDKIGQRLMYDADELVAFKNGLQYTLETYKNTIKGCINSKISARVKLAMSALDEEIEAILAN